MYPVLPPVRLTLEPPPPVAHIERAALFTILFEGCALCEHWIAALLDRFEARP